jgi:acyl dehydratase
MSALQDALTDAEARIGSEVGLSYWITVDQQMIDDFAKTTLDEQWIHTDPERAARESPFGGTIAHGFLTLSLASRFVYDALGMSPGQTMGVNYGMNKLRFLAPVPSGARLRGRFVLTGVTPRHSGLLRTHTMTVEIEGSDTPALVAEWLGLSIFED